MNSPTRPMDSCCQENRPQVQPEMEQLQFLLLGETTQSFKRSSPELERKRMLICLTCPFYEAEVRGQCSKCSCVVDSLAQWEIQKCPIDKW